MQQCTAEGQGLQKATKYQVSRFVVHVRNEFGSPCTYDQNVHAELRHCHTAAMPQVKADVKLLDTPGDYEVVYIPQCTGDHELNVFINGQGINGSPFKIFVDNLPDPQHCTVSGPGIKSMKKDKRNSVYFQIKLADSDNEQCVLPQGVPVINDIISVNIRAKHSGKQVQVTVVPESASDYRVSYTPAVAGTMRVSVRVNRVHIKKSPRKVRVDNPPDLSMSRTSFSDVHTFKKSKTKSVTADVYLMDSYNEPCVFEQKVSVVIMRRPSPMAQSTMETICTNIICKSPSHYQVCFIPDRAGKWMVQVKINRMLAFGSPLQITIKNCPSIEHCKVYDVPKQFVKGDECALKLRLADSDGEDCVFPQHVTASVLTPGSETSVEAKVITTLSSHQYEISFTPFKTGSHTVQFQVEHIGEYCHKVSVVNEQDLQNCIASGPGLSLVKKDKSKPVSFLIKLADSDNEPCVSPQNVSVTLTMIWIGVKIPATVDPESASVYHVSYTPAVAGEMEVSIMVNGDHIKNSPCTVRVDNPPDLRKRRTSFSDIHTFKKSKTKSVTADVYLMDSYNEPCVFEQKVSVVIMRRRPSSMAQSTKETICTDIICKSPSHYQVCFIPDRAGKWMVQVKINGMLAFGSSLQITIDNPPSFEHCKVYDVPKQFVKGDECALKLRLADSDGEDCVFPQHVTVSVSIPGSETSVEAKVITLSSHQYQISFIPSKTGSHTVQFQINGISKCPYKMFVINKPDPQHCIASGPGLEVVKMDKSNPVSFLIELADSNNEPCVSPQNVAVTMTMIETEEKIPQTVVPLSASVYRVSYTPAVAGEMKVSVMVNGVHTKNSPWTVCVDNPPDLSRTSISDIQTIKKSKSKMVTADIYLMDSYNKPCVFEQRVSAIIMRRPSPMAQSTTTETLCADIMCKSPSQYQIRFIPDKAGEWMVQVEINGMLAFGSPLQITIKNCPSIEHCKVYDVPKEFVKGEMCALKIRLADSDGEDCVFPQHVTASVSIPGSETSVEAKLTTLSSHQYQMSFIPFKPGSHTVQFQVEHIGECSYNVSVVNEPDPRHCTASGPVLSLVKKDKSKPVSFLVRLADSDNEPCVSPQKVSVTLTMTETGEKIPATVVPESASVYHVSYTPAVAGEMKISVWVNGVHINNSPWTVYIYYIDNPPDPRHCVAECPRRTLKDSRNAVSFSVHLLDKYKKTSVTSQNVEVHVNLTMIKTGKLIPVTVVPVGASDSVYRVSYTPAVAGRMQVFVTVNEVPIKNSPWTVDINERSRILR